MYETISEEVTHTTAYVLLFPYLYLNFDSSENCGEYATTN